MGNGTNKSIKKGIEEKAIYQEKYVEEKMILDEQPQLVEGQFLSTTIHRSIGAFTFSNVKKYPSAGSGVLISRNLVLTAAHNLYDKEKKQELNKKTYRFYYQAKDGIATRFYEVADWRFMPQYITCKEENNFQFDYALLKLEESVDLLTLPCKICLDSKKQQLGIFGYPKSGSNYKSDSHGKSIKLRQFGLKREFRIALFDPQGQLIGYRISTSPGHSGSPVIFDEKIIAVHNGAGRKNQDFNIGKLVTKKLLNNLTSWADQLKGERFFTSTCEHVVIQTGLTLLIKYQAKAKPAQQQLHPKREELLEKALTLYRKGCDEYIDKKSYSVARNYFSQCLQIQIQIQAVGKGGIEMPETLWFIGGTYNAQGNHVKAIEHYKQLVSIKEKYSQERHRLYTSALSSLGQSYKMMKDFKSGAEYFEQRLLHNQQIQQQRGAKQCAQWLVRNSKFWGGSQRAEELIQKYKIEV